MVFEAVVVELLNKFLKQYIENLDSSQLKIGIWGGDVVLKDLQIKSSILDNLNLPVGVKWGRLGKLAMKIPWKNLYSGQVVIQIEGLLLVIIPNREMKYDAVKEDKWAQDKKQAKLRAIEEAKRRELEAGTRKESDSFVEKLVTQITKNLQVVIKDFHIRYEDKTTIPKSPFSAGITLRNLSVLSTANNPNINYSQFLKDNVNLICKIVNLEGLALYWNSNSKLFGDLPMDKLEDVLVQSIPKNDYKPEDFMYLFGPLSASAFVRLNPKPEVDGSQFKIPKAFVNVHLKEVELAVTHRQFNDALCYVKEFQRFLAGCKYLKYRPIGIPVIGHAKEWWRFAYTAVLEDIIRRKKEWSWGNIKNHRNSCRKYRELYKVKLNSKKMTAEDARTLADLEKKLNVFNLVLIREQVSVEVQRRVKELKSGGWFSGWFGSGAESKSGSNSDELVDKLRNVMTPGEKEKLYKAIGYEESSPSTNYPSSFVLLQFWFHLDEIRTLFYDDRTPQLVTILSMSVKALRMEMEQRAGPGAMKFVMIIENFGVKGMREKGYNCEDVVGGGGCPDLIKSNCSERESLIELLYETKPLDSSADLRLNLNARPLSIIYHADTINLLREVFVTKTSKDVGVLVSPRPRQPLRIQAATSASLPAFRKITSLGLQYAIEKRTEMEVKVNIMSSYLIIPLGGSYHADKDMVVLLLGKLSIETEENTLKDIKVKQLYLEGTTDEEIFSTVLSASYTIFKCHLTGVQILYQLPGEDWVTASNLKKSPLQLLEPTNLEVTVKKSLVMDDARIPKLIVEGKLPSIAFNLQEERIISLIGLVASLEVKTKKRELKKTFAASVLSLQSIGQLEPRIVKPKEVPRECVVATEYTQGIDFVGHFEMNELAVSMSKSKATREEDGKVRDSKANLVKVFHTRIIKLEVDVTVKTFEAIHFCRLGGFEFKMHHNKDWLPFVSTKQALDSLLTVEFVRLNTKIPDFFTGRGGIVNNLMLKIGALNVQIDKDALLSQLEFFTNFQRKVQTVQAKYDTSQDRFADSGKEDFSWTDFPPSTYSRKFLGQGGRMRKKSAHKEVIDFLLQVRLDEVDLVVQMLTQGIAEVIFSGGSFDLSIQKSYTVIDVNLREISLSDLNELTRYSKILAPLDKQTITTRIMFYNKDYFEGEHTLDMAIDAEVGAVQFIFVSLFFSRAFDYMSAFQSQIETLKQGVTLAAEKAKENVLKAYKNAAEVFLKVKVAAPIILIPSSSTSWDLVAIDLGVLTIKNTITELEYSPDEGPALRPVIDVLKVHLQNLKISRCSMNPQTNTLENERNFLVPVSFDLNLKRNLSVRWFTVIPELEIVAQLAAVRVTLTHEDFNAILNTFRENLREGSTVSQISKPSKVQKTAPVQCSSKQPDRDRSRLRSGWAEEEEEEEEEEQQQQGEERGDVDERKKFHTTVKFMFFMDSFVFDAVNISPDKVHEQLPLARFLLKSLSINGRMFSNNTIHTSAMLLSCVLEDTRPGRQGMLTRLLERSVDATEDPKDPASQNKSMFELTFHKKDADTFINARVYKFTLVLSMDFLHKLGQFFTVEDMEPVSVDRSSRTRGRQTAAPVEVPETTMTLNLRLEKPDIIFVENMDLPNPDALLFHTELTFKYRMVGPKHVVNGTLKNIQLNSCCFNPSQRPEILNQVIKPFTVSLAGSTPEGVGMHLDVCLTEIFINVNPGTVNLISKCLEVLLQEAATDVENPDDVDRSDLWLVKKFEENDFWFLKPELGQDAMSLLRSYSSMSLDFTTPNEICLVAIPTIRILLEGVSTTHAQPLILLEMGFQMRCTNWSLKMFITSTLTMSVQYYSRRICDWEYLLEPVERTSCTGEVTYTPWEITCNVAFGEEGELDIRPPKVQVTVTCTDVMQLTLTKGCMDVLKETVDKFTTAVTQHKVVKFQNRAPISVKNETGLVVELLLDQSKLQVYKQNPEQQQIILLDTNSDIELRNIPMASELRGSPNLFVMSKDTHLFAKFPTAGNEVFDFPLSQTSMTYHLLPKCRLSTDEVCSFVCYVKIVDNSATVVFHGVVTVYNHFNEPIHLHTLSKDGKHAEHVGVVERGSAFNLPLTAIYGGTKELFFSVEGYSLSKQSFNWKQLKDEQNLSMMLSCTSRTPEKEDPFFIQAVGETERILLSKTRQKSNKCKIFKIHLNPTVKFFNSLPYPIVICCQGSAEENVLQPGNSLQLPNAEPGTSSVTVRIPDYLEKEWSCKQTLKEDPPEFSVWKFTCYKGLAQENLNLGVHVSYKRKTPVYTVYCPYFMINKTDRLLSYKFQHSSQVVFHPADLNLPVLFSCSSKKFFHKKWACLQVDQGSWSDSFPVDVAGSGGTIECKTQSLVNKVSVSISLLYTNLTRVVVFTPYHVLINSTNNAIECKEINYHCPDWLEVPPHSYLPFWPKSHDRDNTMKLRVKGSQAVSTAFTYQSTDVCLLRLDDRHGGIFVNVSSTQLGSYIRFESFEPGQAPALLMNHSNRELTIREVNTDHSVRLLPQQQVLHAWVKPSGERKFVIGGGKTTKTLISVNQDDDGVFYLENDQRLRYVTFLDGPQRVLLFTEDPAISRSISNLKLSSSGLEVVFKIQGVGVSLVDEVNQFEILYVSLISSGILWETKKARKTFYKKMKPADAQMVENAYQMYEEQKEEEGFAHPVVSIHENLKVDFEEMMLLENQPKELRRTFEPGFWAVYRLLEDQRMLHLKINKLQVDSQLLECVFPVVMAEVPPPKTVNYEGPKPFFELSVVKVSNYKSGIEQYKYFKTLIQEFHVKMDIGFIQHLNMFLTSGELTDEQEKTLFRKDLEFMSQPINAHVEVVASNEQKNFYDWLHFSPLKIHFSFSMAGKMDTSNLPPMVSVLLRSVGVTLTDFHDVIFRLSYLDRRNVFLTNKELINEIIAHYKGQIIRQAYVLVLGLDVIGNPFGLIVGIGEGVEAFFYEPFQGIIQGPSEFGRGVAIGWQRMVHGTVGSAAGALGKLTNSLGKGLAALSLDKEYQMQRMAEHNQPGNIQASMARGGRGLLMGVVEGVTGVVGKPIKGAKEEGAAGFFKGMGKGMMGLLTRPVTGVVDFASTSFNAVKNMTVPTGSEVKRYRPPRFFRHDRVEPYNTHDATGQLLLYLTCKRKYCESDKYEYHEKLKEKEVVLLTSKRVILAEYSGAFGTWQEHMAITWASMPDRPRCHTKGIAITMPARQGATKNDVKVLIVDNPQKRQEICKRMIEIFHRDRELSEE